MSRLPRRSVLTLAAAAAAATLGGCRSTPPVVAGRFPTVPVVPARIRAVALDALAVFDPGSVTARCEQLFPGHGERLATAWRARQFEYAWIRAAAGQAYVGFWHITEQALVYAASTLSIDLAPYARRELMSAQRSLKPWPDTVAAVHALKEAGLQVAILSNFSLEMLRACMQGSGLDGAIDHVLSTDLAGAFKPDPRAYQLGVRAVGVPREEIAFAAFGGWDAAGAKWFGFRTYWVNRLGLPVEQLGAMPDAVVSTLAMFAESVRVSPRTAPALHR